MGVTIHFEGKLIDDLAYQRVLEFANAFATHHGWPNEPIAERQVTLQRVRNEEDWDYTGPVKGITLHPHPDCDPVHLKFDENLYVQEYCKTQFAGAEAHILVIELLRLLKPQFRNLTVEDEGEYWETGDRAALENHIRRCAEAMRDILDQKPNAHGPVRLPSGRIVDIMS